MHVWPNSYTSCTSYTSFSMCLFVSRYDPERGRFTDPPSEYITAVDRTENYKYCESCVRQAAQEEVNIINNVIMTEV